jgi:hypothetical protein
MSDEETWLKVDEYLDELFVGDDAALDAALEASEKAGLPAIAVSPTHGKLLHLLAKLQGAKRILEVGTLGGYSTIWLARALPEGGKLITLEYVAKHAEVAGQSRRAGLADKVEVRVGPALSTPAPRRVGRRRAVRRGVHRRRQAEQSGLPRMGVEAHAQGKPDHRRQRGAPRARAGREEQGRESRACADSMNCWRPNHG